MIFMAIQLPDVGTGVPADQTGDSPWLAMKKVRENFNDQTNAASRLVGKGANNVPLCSHVKEVTLRALPTSSNDKDPNTSEVGSFYGYGWSNTAPNLPDRSHGSPAWFVETRSGHTSTTDNTYSFQIAYPAFAGGTSQQYSYAPIMTRRNNQEWQPAGQTPATYSTTTADGANVVVDTSGKLMRSTSSERYKDILSPLELDDAKYADAMALKPIVYRSTADADNPAYHYYSFSAEELGAYDPAFTLWRDTETVTDEDGNVTEQPLVERQAEGININALLAISHAIAIKQGELIKDLQEQVNALKLQTEV